MKQKRLGALLLTLCMTIGLLPDVVIPASAAVAPIYWGVTAGNELILSSAEADTAACTDKGSFPSDSCSFSLGDGSVDLDAIPWKPYRKTITKVTVKDTVAPIGSVSYLFYGLSCTTMDLGGLDTSNVTDMRGMFYLCKALTSLDLSGFDTANVTDMGSMFELCYALTDLDVSGFDTAKVTEMDRMFLYCTALTNLDVSNFNTSNVTDMFNMFYCCKALTTLDLSNFNTSNVTNMGDMFSGCEALTNLDVSNFDTSKVTEMFNMFSKCRALTTLDLSSFDTSKVIDMKRMFQNCEALTMLDLSNFNTSNVKYMSEMFGECKALTTLDLSSFDTSKVGMNTFEMLSGLEGLKTLTISDSVAALMGKDDTGMTTDLYTCTAVYPNDDYGRIAGLSAGTYATSPTYPAHTLSKTEATATCEADGLKAYWTCSVCGKYFSDGKGEAKITDLAAWKAGEGKIVATGHVYDNDQDATCNICGYTRTVAPVPIYWGVTAGNELILSSAEADTAGCTDKGSFPSDRCDFKSSVVVDPDTIPWKPHLAKITKVTVKGTVAPIGEADCFLYGLEQCTAMDLNGLDTSNVTSMDSMFCICKKLTSLDLSHFVTSKVTNMDSMFYECSALTSLNVSGFDTAKVTEMGKMFYMCSTLTSLDVSSFDTAKVRNMGWMFGRCGKLTSLDLSHFNTSEVTDMYAMFYECSALTSLNVSGFDTAKVKNMGWMFGDCGKLTSLDLSHFNASEVTDMESMFYRCDALKTLTISETMAAAIGNYNTSLTKLYAVENACTATAYLKDSDGKIAGLTAGTYATIFHGAHHWGKWTLQGDGETLKRVCDNNSTHTESKTLTVTVAPGPFTYNGTAQKPAVTLTADGASLSLNADYAVAYADNVSIGTGKITITGRGDYAFSLEREFTIAKATVDGSALTPGSLNIANCLEKEYVYTLTYLCPTINGDWGERSYAIEKVEFTEAGYYADNTARIDKAEGGTYANRLYLPILSNDTTTTGWVGTVTIRFSSSNYEDYTNTVKIMATNKTSVTFQGDPTNDKVYDSQPYAPAMERLTVWDGAEDVTGKATVEVTYTGRGATSYSPADPHTPPTDAGEYAVTIRVVDADPEYIGRTSYNIVISQAPGVGSVTMENYTEGQTPSQPTSVSATNGTEHVSYQYKAKDAADETYVAVQPTKAGAYTVRATFPAVRNYTEAVATADFTVTKATVPEPQPSFSDDDDDDDDDDYYTLTATTGEGGSIAPGSKVSVRRNDSKTFTITPAEGYTIADVLVDGKSVGAVDSYTFEKIVKAHTIEARFQVADKASGADCPRDATCPIHAFTDAKTTVWYHDGVHYCLENGLMVGVSGTAFAPDTNISRAMVATILWRLAGSPDTDMTGAFDDVPSKVWYAEAVAWAVSTGVVKGYGNGSFGPNDPVTREQLAAMLYRYEQKINGGGFTGSWMFPLDFTDATQISGWADEAMHYMTMHGIIQGMGKKSLAPRGQATRAQTAAIFQRFCESAAK